MNKYNYCCDNNYEGNRGKAPLHKVISKTFPVKVTSELRFNVETQAELQTAGERS